MAGVVWKDRFLVNSNSETGGPAAGPAANANPANGANDPVMFDPWSRAAPSHGRSRTVSPVPRPATPNASPASEGANFQELGMPEPSWG